MSLSFLSLVGHRLMSRLPSQFLLPAASPIPPLSKKGCFRESASTSLLDGSYSNMLSIRSNNRWCSSASDSKYRWQGKGRTEIRETSRAKFRMSSKELQYQNNRRHCPTSSTLSCACLSLHPFKALTRRGLQFSLTYFPAEELSSQSKRPR